MPDIAVTREALTEIGKYIGGYLEPSIELTIGSSMEELEKGLEELKGFASIGRTTIPTNHISQSSHKLNHQPKLNIESLMAPATYVTEDSFVKHQW